MRALNTVMPAMGLGTLVLTVVAAVLARNETPHHRLLIAMLAYAFLDCRPRRTRLMNQPINALIMTRSIPQRRQIWSALRVTPGGVGARPFTRRFRWSRRADRRHCGTAALIAEPNTNR